MTKVKEYDIKINFIKYALEQADKEIEAELNSITRSGWVGQELVYKLPEKHRKQLNFKLLIDSPIDGLRWDKIKENWINYRNYKGTPEEMKEKLTDEFIANIIEYLENRKDSGIKVKKGD